MRCETTRKRGRRRVPPRQPGGGLSLDGKRRKETGRPTQVVRMKRPMAKGRQEDDPGNKPLPRIGASRWCPERSLRADLARLSAHAHALASLASALLSPSPCSCLDSFWNPRRSPKLRQRFRGATLSSQPPPRTWRWVTAGLRP